MESLGAANIQFGFDLFKVLKKTENGNVFFSPVGISTAIGMILLGTRGATASQLQKVGRFRWFPDADLLQGVQSSSLTLLKRLILTCGTGNNDHGNTEQLYSKYHHTKDIILIIREIS